MDGRWMATPCHPRPTQLQPYHCLPLAGVLGHIWVTIVTQRAGVRLRPYGTGSQGQSSRSHRSLIRPVRCGSQVAINRPADGTQRLGNHGPLMRPGWELLMYGIVRYSVARPTYFADGHSSATFGGHCVRRQDLHTGRSGFRTKSLSRSVNAGSVISYFR